MKGSVLVRISNVFSVTFHMMDFYSYHFLVFVLKEKYIILFYQNIRTFF